ncbi:MAG: hypothetical protein PHU23_02205 [Dehalococcoidales bacterium]|nr:hypothetical protein [Dehalococcoidales bacterium]
MPSLVRQKKERFICPVMDDRHYPICQRCPLPYCKYDKTGREYFAKRNQGIYWYWLEGRCQPAYFRPKLLAIAMKFGINTRQQVWEIIQKERNRIIYGSTELPTWKRS